MAPHVLGLDTYHLFWGLAIGVWTVGGVALARRAQFGLGRSVAALGLMLIAMLVGAKLQHLRENPARWAGSWSTLLWDGYRLPGGIAFAGIAVPLGLIALRLPLRRFLDAIIPVAPLSFAIGRVGCFLNGCCFGTITTVPWGVRFPVGSRPYATQQLLGFSPTPAVSLPVHPLQLYYTVVLLMMALLLFCTRTRYEGWRTRVFLVLWAWSTVGLEHFRSVEALRARSYVQEVALGLALLATALLIGGESLHRRARRAVR